jgi:hypothetical protein
MSGWLTSWPLARTWFSYAFIASNPAAPEIAIRAGRGQPGRVHRCERRGRTLVDEAGMVRRRRLVLGIVPVVVVLGRVVVAEELLEHGYGDRRWGERRGRMHAFI